MGFFDLLTDAPTIRGDERISTHASIKKAQLTCEDCKLYEGCRAPKLRFTGEGAAGIMIVGEQPSYEDEEAGSLGHGQEYRFLKEALVERGISIHNDCYFTTAINCAPTKQRPPTYKEITACRPRLLRLMEKLNPKTVIVLGETGYNALIEPRLSGRITDTPYTAFMGEHIPDQQYQRWVTPIWSVQTLMERRNYDDGNQSKPRYERDPAYYNIWKKHLWDACNLSTFYVADYRDQLQTTTDESTAIRWLKEALTWKRVAFDYETTGRKPHRTGHKIVSVSISDGFVAYGFPFFNSKEFLASWETLMLSDVKKIGQNISYEMLWTKTILGYYPKNWEWDTMLGQHCLANQKPTGLKFMVYTIFGQPGYDGDIDQFLKATSAEEAKYGANAINQIDRAPFDKLLIYNALDSLYTYKLADIQRGRISDYQLEGFRFFLKSAQTLTIAQENGFNIDMKQHAKVEASLDELMLKQHKLIMSNPVLEQWPQGDFNYQSSPQLSTLLYEILKVKPTGYTGSGKPSVDEEALSKMDVPIVKDILAYRKLFKMRNTYISQYAVEVVDGKIHPYFNINRVDTFRSCVAKGSKVLVPSNFIDSPDGVCIEDIKAGDYVYTYDDNLKLTIKRVVWAGKTGHKHVIRLHYKGGQRHSKILHLDVTPEHLIRTISGEYVQAQYLLDDYRDRTDPKWRYLPKSRVLSVARQGDRLFPTNAPEILEHRMVYEYFGKEALHPDDIIHHLDGNHLNHTFSNLKKTDSVEHASLHYPETIGTNESRKKNVEATRRAHEEGRYTYYSGEDNVNALALTRTQCLRIFVKARGVMNNGFHDFETYKKWCMLRGLDMPTLQIRYNSKGEYISRWKLQKAMCLGVRGAQTKLGVGRYRLKQLCEYYGVDPSLYFKGSKYRISPWKDVSLHNHMIASIEVLPDAIDVYDIEVEDTHNFIANEICVHNSSSAPNIQNQPKRDKEAKKLLREFIKPSRGNRIVERDYKSLEVCFSKNTMVRTLEGDKSIREVVAGDYVFGYDVQQHRVCLRPVEWSGKTGENRKTLNVLLDNGEIITCTPTHQFMLRNGDYVEAQSLTAGTSLMPLYTSIRKTTHGVNYRWVNLNNGKHMELHNLIALDVYGVQIKGSDKVVHHIDSNGCNNTLANLQIVTRKEHMRIHAIQGWESGNHSEANKRASSPERLARLHAGRQRWWDSLSEDERKAFFASTDWGDRSGSNNAHYGKHLTPEQKEKIAKTKRGKPLSPEHIQKLAESNRAKWKSPEYRERMKGRMSGGNKKGYRPSAETRAKLSEAGKGKIVSAETREKLRQVAMRRWHPEMFELAPPEEYNHKVVSVTWNEEKEDVYCLTVAGTHNFALSAGVIVHNCINAAYSRDPMLVKYITDPTTDMHRDSAADCFLLKPEEVTKALRNDVKGQFVFAEMYGSFYKQVAKDLWETAHKHDLVKHLSANGVRNFDDFERHIEEAERILWEERFPVHNEWREQQWKFYQKHGYVELLTGFRCYGPMKRNNTFNSPVQGAGYHVLQWTMNQVNKKVMKLERSKLIGEIHDSCVSDEHDSEADLIDYWYWYYGTQKVREHWDWIIVPLTVEKEQSEIDGSWADMKDVGALKGDAD